MSDSNLVTGLTVVGSFVAFALAYAIGANDVANALGTSVGSKAITLKQAFVIGGIFEFLGTVTMGSLVSSTLKAGVVDPNTFDGDLYILGMFCALLASAIWIIIASIFGLPVSTTQTIVGGIVGFGLVEKGTKAVEPLMIMNIGLSWVISPILGGVISFLLMYTIKRTVLATYHPQERALQLLPLFSGGTLGILCLFIISAQAKVFPQFNRWYILFSSFIGTFGIVFAITRWVVVPWLRRKSPIASYMMLPPKSPEGAEKEEEEETVDVEEESLDFRSSTDALMDESFLLTSREQAERYFIVLMLLSAIFVAFAHGANDVANAVGPYAAIVEYKMKGSIDGNSRIPIWIIFAGGIGIVIGLATLGYRVMRTVGEQITKLTFSRGFSAQLGTATTVLLATYLGLPISSTTTLIGAVTAIGFIAPVDRSVLASNTKGAVNKKLLLKIFASWVFTVLIGGILTSIFYVIGKSLFKL